MINQILQIYNEGNVSLLTDELFTCKYCQKSFRKEKTLFSHICEKGRRYRQQNEKGVQIGFQTYLRFYEITQGSAKLKSYADFATNSLYTAFVKFGRHIVAIRAVNTKAFIEYVLKQNKKIDRWCDEANYVEYLYQYLRREAVQDAMERALIEMQMYTDETPTITNFSNYFRQGNSNRICQHIINGRISPWVVYNCASGVDFLGTLSEEQIGLIINYIDPDYWQRRFKDYLADAEWCKHILKTSGL